MKVDLNNFRKNYQKGKLLLKDLTKNPMELFDQWFKQANSLENFEANAMTLSTVDQLNEPNARIVLLKEYGEKGFVFFTNYHSQKGKDIAQNPMSCISFFWPHTEQQVIVHGKAEKVSKEASDKYFYSRPTNSQAAAIVSQQSDVLESKEELEKRHEALLERLNEGWERPENWGGYVISPEKMEFWQGRPDRLHDRVLYVKSEEKGWDRMYLYP